ncbi:MAG: NAD(P)H-dependent oxidoreductase subunit E [Candidatus Omnitrophica bacterium]|nr:NAD(P)H-dependent oxidoreductase subunit E [Candidatus Omnitrophota bacterium]MBU1996967.1 NAD(P)H-dependent oxidoreductase subunit E [Candidatus Omnitrophota bacterium]MBU4334784.1 NAD(P)H-dependent oxidoreductase subunit E [Candidatus Omnitrophota bacterium]
MSQKLSRIIKNACESCGNDRNRLMDIVTAIQKECGAVTLEAMDIIAKELNVQRVDVESVVSFYSFLSKEEKGKVVIRICNDVVDILKGAEDVAKVFSETLGIEIGQTAADGSISLEYTPCIGLSDQAPAVLINDVAITNLTVDKAKSIANDLKNGVLPESLTKECGDGNNANDLVKSMVKNNIIKKGSVIFAERQSEAGLEKAITMSPSDVISLIKASKVRGRGGAGFPTGMKWEFTRAAKGDKKYVVCNADEGEPGTFKDRVLLTEKFDMLCEGMAIGGYCIGSDSGIIYLRGEYAYLKAFLEKKLSQRKEVGLLGANICGKDGFNFDIRIQIGAGAYICGEETALISSCEGLRGDPKTRPPFPAQKGYLASPTTVNNVETFCSIAKILEKDAAWYSAIGTKGSTGTKILSISGDCSNPGIYEYDFGVKVSDMLKDAGAEDTKAVLIGGPSGQLIGKTDFNRIICYDDLATGGSIVIFNSYRNILEIVKSYLEFFVEESCGYCTPCRTGNVLLLNKIEEILEGKGEPSDIKYLEDLCSTVKVTSRCGLGQTSPNPVLTSIKNFREVYDAVLKLNEDGRQPTFDIKASLEVAEALQGRKSVIY